MLALFNEAKKKLLRIIFGGNPGTDLPFLWKLRSKVEKSVEIILGLEKYEFLHRFFEERPNPKFSRISYVIAEKE